ncbi:SDR family NAD(P)-dependent oxidoreductase [Mycobacterium avium subsp. hominissuis]|uniref:oxidoreductase n=1 Tax=Mycobacterium avium TaxID=1764 RepID=UPI0003924A30|nr:oxidoreductase [Mycobacterium avium]MBZ4560830.1 SDR family NAD(P)-dependent oxidoreductase [Mycobacterium avium subsp. hominissuis]MBZ4570393.1 SDR family NAD(P)-dependent oxidoreductase [Mycobacterium avium subsp. hominissuis]MBZ4589101.1 SDR family NAD(P)-dependent oxidoreductase [Mycobacterium avium subsp. hominissuis]MBZ4626352.1 SDR family NAD(P)-dependent oxidoreductase [Mycobacterium avium subsp. hominissuis]BAN33467.1 short chain dehydrogenase/reductase SDR [Mycobacterium avium sub
MPKTWFITGSSRGLGRALTTAVLDRGDQVVATARRPAQLDELVDRYGPRIRACELDVTDRAAARRAIAAAVTAFGRIDVVVNNAGYANSAPVEEVSDDDFRAQVETNFFGVVNVTKAALPVLHRQRAGHIVQISSVGGRVGGSPGIAAYQASKFAVAGFSEALAAEVAPLGIKVTIAEPGALRTEWAGSSMAVATVSPDYESTVGAMNRRRAGFNRNAPGDPARAAHAIIEVVMADDPPLRLLLGSDALSAALAKSHQQIAEANRWAELSKSIDYPPVATPHPAARSR